MSKGNSRSVYRKLKISVSGKTNPLEEEVPSRIYEDRHRGKFVGDLEVNVGRPKK